MHTIRKHRSRQSFTRKRTLFWLGIIAVISFIVSAFTGHFHLIIERFYNYMDTSYRPMDRDRGIILHQKLKEEISTPKKAGK